MEWCGGTCMVRREVWLFWAFGLINNAGFVIMNAGAKQISSGGVGLVYLANILPALLVKGSASLWFDRFTYDGRILFCNVLMVCSFLLVALSDQLGWQLFGVALTATQSALGEASVLALGSFYGGATALTAWSSGTGMAGIFGYAWIIVLHVFCGLSFTVTILAANILVAAWLYLFFRVLDREPYQKFARSVRAPQPVLDGVLGATSAHSTPSSSSDTKALLVERSPQPYTEPPADHDDAVPGPTSINPLTQASPGASPLLPYQDPAIPPPTATASDTPSSTLSTRTATSTTALLESGPEVAGPRQDAAEPQLVGDKEEARQTSTSSSFLGGDDELTAAAAYDDDAVLTPTPTSERLFTVIRMWRLTVPLLVVYFSEYAMQSGTWSAIGFPVKSDHSRELFYEYANFSYQVGVFVSRSSGTIFRASLRMIWTMPVLQFFFLCFFTAVALEKFWYDYGLLPLCFITGLLGGCVYVQAFIWINNTAEPHLREMSMSACSVADTAGIVLGSLTGVFLQACIYDRQGVGGAVVDCPTS